MKRPPLSKERWQQVDELFQATLERPRDQRAAFLQQACAGDSDLRREVESLIAADAGSDSFMHQPVHAEAAAVGEGPGPSMAGQRLGPYQLFRELGQGGMGAVYLAARVDDEYRQQVTVKLIRPGLDSGGILRRFRNERQILASLNHPNIARLLDGGTTDVGLPYFVMEYIEGEPIDQYCDSHMLSIDERLELFRTVCSAVHYAHQNLVVHRDIKPANILVTAEGVPKLLDFGIAKLLNPELSAQTIHATGIDLLRLMTPAYASPEQVQGGTITTTTDVYSLGVLLYELLTGHRPYRFETSRPQEVERVVCDTEPEKPSTAVLGAVETAGGERLTPETLSRRRGGRPEGLRRQLTGDLDNIVLMAMRKEPRRRYASALQFADDLTRHRDGLPVVARPSTFGYLAGKFARRHKWGVVFAGLLVVFAVAMTVQSLRLDRQRDRADQARLMAEAERETAERERETAETERERAEQVSDFLVKLFTISNPSEGNGERVTAGELLRKGAATIDQELRDQPGTRAALMHTMGMAYLGLGLYNDAEELIENALALRRQTFDEEHLEVAESLNDLAVVLRYKGEYERAGKLTDQALAMRRRLGADPVDVAHSLYQLGQLLLATGDYQGAEEQFVELLPMIRDLRGEDHPTVGVTLNNLAVTLHAKGDFEGAQTRYRETLAMHRRALGDDHPEVARTLGNLAAASHAGGDHEEAAARFREALASYRQIGLGDHPDVAIVLNNHASLLVETGDIASAETEVREALDIFRRSGFPANHWRVAQAENTLGACFTGLGRYQDAEDLLLGSYQALRQTKGETAPYTHTALRRLVALYEAWGDVEKAADHRRILRESGGISSG